MPGLSEVREVALETPFGTPSDAYVLGNLAGRKVAFLARHGRGHRLMPTELNYRANIHGLKQLGVERVISLSAVGSLKEEHRPLDFVIPDQFVDRLGIAWIPSLAMGSWYTLGSGIPSARKRRECLPKLAARRRECEAGRHVPEHGRAAVLD